MRKKIYFVSIICLLIGILCGCNSKISTISYSYEEVEATITNIYLEDYEDKDCADGDWCISVEYNGVKFVDSGCISNGVPEYVNFEIGDVVTVQIENEYIDGKLSKRTINKIIG